MPLLFKCIQLSLPCLLPQKEGDHSRSEWWRIYFLPATIASLRSRGLSSVSLTADSSLCGGSLLGAASYKASPERGGARPRRAEGSVPSASRIGRGGSVSRRDHNQAAGNAPTSHGRTSPEKSTKPIPSHSSGEGVWGRGASLREAASPPESPHVNLFGREREGGGFSTEKPPPSQYSVTPFPEVPSIWP